MHSALIHFEPGQKLRLAKRARKRGESFSQEVRNAVDLYLALPIETQEELDGLAAAARQSAERSVKHLDQTISALDRILKRARKSR